MKEKFAKIFIYFLLICSHQMISGTERLLLKVKQFTNSNEVGKTDWLVRDTLTASEF